MCHSETHNRRGIIISNELEGEAVFGVGVEGGGGKNWIVEVTVPMLTEQTL